MLNWETGRERYLAKVEAKGGDEGEYQNSEVHKEPRDQRARGVAKRKKALQDESWNYVIYFESAKTELN